MCLFGACTTFFRRATTELGSLHITVEWFWYVFPRKTCKSHGILSVGHNRAWLTSHNRSMVLVRMFTQNVQITCVGFRLKPLCWRGGIGGVARVHKSQSAPVMEFAALHGYSKPLVDQVQSMIDSAN